MTTSSYVCQDNCLNLDFWFSRSIKDHALSVGRSDNELIVHFVDRYKLSHRPLSSQTSDYFSSDNGPSIFQPNIALKSTKLKTIVWKMLGINQLKDGLLRGNKRLISYVLHSVFNENYYYTLEEKSYIWMLADDKNVNLFNLSS